ncbi:hypothetical protein 1 [Hubei sobemo-like virus 7]|uniref:hypothetical protein 1 n=1 Tax=Hubei sobemo-like virus 7 TaxID=1923240 RepID=UPI000909A5A7|nr:hypothetical protein 1 [Hubei sobemo-like virus 7]APG75849.1 hypothetical protein 1 [Hubei sobemo-like virus 7]
MFVSSNVKAMEQIEMVLTMMMVSLVVTLSVKMLTELVRWYLRRRAQYLYAKKQEDLGRLPESMREGSDLVTVPLANFPFVVGLYSVRRQGAAEKVYLGTGTLLEGWLVTAGHVVETAAGRDMFALTYDGVYHELGQFHTIYTDLVMTKAPQGYKSGRVEALQLASYAQLVAARGTANSSMGILKHDTQVAFGFCSYSGSSVQGFSGAPYTNGSKVLAIHLGGGTSGNYGYSASFVMAQIHVYKRPESSELEAMERAMKSAKKEDIEWERGLDETRVRVGGRYFTLDNDEFDEWSELNEFGEWFYDEEPESKRKRFRVKRKAVDYEEPDYEPEGVEDPFLESKPPKDSSSGALEKRIELLAENIASIQSLLTSQSQDMGGLKERLNKLDTACVSMRNIESKLSETFASQLTMSVNTLEQRLTAQIKSVSDARPHPEKTASTNGSDTSSPPSIPEVPQVSVSSGSTQPSVMRWATMDSDFATMLEWRNSVDRSSPSYPHWREEYMTQKGFSTEQKKALVVRLKNYKVSSQRKVARKAKSAIQ